MLAGDCLFTMGCGRVFTGDFQLMQASLSKLRDLPDDTVVSESPVNGLLNGFKQAVLKRFPLRNEP